MGSSSDSTFQRVPTSHLYIMYPQTELPKGLPLNITVLITDGRFLQYHMIFLHIFSQLLQASYTISPLKFLHTPFYIKWVLYYSIVI